MTEAASISRRNVLGMSRDELAATLGAAVDRPYRIEQIYRAIYRQGARDFSAMTVLSKPLRRRLDESYSIELPRVESLAEGGDGTKKYLLRLEDGATVEAVDIPEGKRRTLCLSSQAGCALACAFCVTGYWGAGRDLTAGEIVAQVLVALRSSPDRSGLNLVFMGMGEPLLNLPAVRAALDILTEEIPWRRITVSTVGLIPGIEELADWTRRPNLAVSLHAPDDERRSALMPVNSRYPIGELLDCLRAYPLEGRRRLTFEYILIRGFNDRGEDAKTLATLLRGLRCKVNLIPLNPDPVLTWPERIRDQEVGERMQAPSPAAVERFRRQLVRHGVPCSVRRARGEDISAACGQLRAFGRSPRRQITA